MENMPQFQQDEERLKDIIRRAGKIATREEVKIKMLEYRMDFGTVLTKIRMSLN